MTWQPAPSTIAQIQAHDLSGLADGSELGPATELVLPAGASTLDLWMQFSITAGTIDAFALTYDPTGITAFAGGFPEPSGPISAQVVALHYSGVFLCDAETTTPISYTVTSTDPTATVAAFWAVSLAPARIAS